MSEAGETYLKELTAATKANRAATFALLGHLRDIAKNSNGRARGGALAKLYELSRNCSSCGQAQHTLEDELHHLHFDHPEVLEADHCPCKYCCPVEGCECGYCLWPLDERVGIPDDEVGTTTGSLL